VNGRAVRVPRGRTRTDSGPRVVVRFRGPVAASWPARIARSGAHIEFWCPPFGACVTLEDDAAAARLASLPFVAGFTPYEERHCQRALRSPRRGVGRRWLDVVCFSRTDRPRVAAELRRLGATVLDEGSTKVRVDWAGDLAAIRDLVGVKLVERPLSPRLAGVGLAADVDAAAADGAWLPGFDGSGEVVAVADTGLDTGDRATLTMDLRRRVSKVVSWPTNPSWSPFVTNPGADDGAADQATGHGTYVAGVALGDGAASAGVHRGVAPAARLVFQAIEQWIAVAPGNPQIGASRFTLAGRPVDLRALFLQARGFGARIHINAWGSPARGAYDNDSFEADLFLHEHRDAVILCAAGNAGRDADGNRRIDPGSLDSPATAKNVVTIGATEGSSTLGFPGVWAQLQVDGRVFANPLDRADPVAGQPDRMAMLSAAGPTADGRVKPDVCAPGTDIVGPRSSLASGNGWGLVNPVPHYMVDGGTSVAVAVAGGCCALVRQAWRAARGGRWAPAGATLKALLVLGAAPVRTRDGNGLEARTVAGFGRIDVSACLPGTAAGGRVVILADSLKRGAVVTGGTRTYKVKLPKGGRLRAVLCWYDAPGERLVNDLDVSLAGPPGQAPAAPIWGNHLAGQPTKPGGPDRVNTVEVIDVDGLAAGTWSLTVTGANVPAGPQPFSLVAGGQEIS
jgi:serine protease AprX